GAGVDQGPEREGSRGARVRPAFLLQSPPSSRRKPGPITTVARREARCGPSVAPH
ncbi:hypothetical protein chiPu_0034007, partial [Chiloscyllium punctatum]|nr:hypothetical protein [Chiloscyllium punctatum]